MSEISLLVLASSVLLVASMVAQGLDHFSVRGRWLLVATCLRATVIILLACTWILAAGQQGQWTPYDLRQGALGLATTSMGTLLALSLLGRRHVGTDSGGMFADLLVLALSILAIAVWPGAPPRPCIQRALPFSIQWGFCLLGLGAIAVAGSASLKQLLQARLPTQAIQETGTGTLSSHWLLRQATSLALLFLGGGLLAGAFWSWRTTGALDPVSSSGDARLGWMAVAWLLAAASHLAWQLRHRSTVWAGVLAILGMSSGMLGLLALSDLLRLLGF